MRAASVHRYGAAGRPKAGELVARDLAAQIVSHQLRPGERFPGEAELIAQYGVSRAVLREAMRILEWYGLVTIRRGRQGGAVAHAPDPEVAARYAALVFQARRVTLHDFDLALEALEPEVVALLSRRRHDARLDLLDRAVEYERASLEDPTEFLIAALRIHTALLVAVDNPVLAALGAVLAEIRERRQLSPLANPVPPSRVQDRRAESHADHVEVIRRIRSGAALRASELWRHHLRWTGQVLPTVDATTILDLFERGITGSEWILRGGPGRRPSRLPTGASIVAGEIRGRILRGELPEGASIPNEAELMQHFGFSRATVREGLRLLEVDHLVRPRRGPRGGGTVTAPSIQAAGWQLGLLAQHAGATVSHVLDARLLLERVAAATLSCARMTAMADDVRAAARRVAHASTGRAEAACQLADLIVEGSPNATLSLLHELTRPLLDVVATAKVADRRRRVSRSKVVAEVEAVLDAAASGEQAALTTRVASLSSTLHRIARPSGDQPIDVFAAPEAEGTMTS